MNTPPPTARLLTPYAWAKEAGCSRQAVYQRIARQDLPTSTADKPDGTPQVYIDATAYPPVANPHGRPRRAPKT